MEFLRFLRWLLGRLWFRSLYEERLSAAADRSREITEPDPKEWFQQVCRRSFSFLEEQSGFESDPPRLHEPGFQNPYLVVYRSRSLIIVVEGLSYGARTRMGLIDREGRLLDIVALVKRRDSKLLKVCSVASGQVEPDGWQEKVLDGLGFRCLASPLRYVAKQPGPVFPPPPASPIHEPAWCPRYAPAQTGAAYPA